MASFFQVYPSYWESALRDGWTDDEVTLGLYLLTCRHRQIEGLYRLPLGYVVEDRGWQLERVKTAMAGLITQGFVEYDATASVVFLVNALKFQCPRGEKQIRGALAALSLLPKTGLLARLIEVAQKVHLPFGEALQKGYPGWANTPLIPLPEWANTPSIPNPELGAPDVEPEPDTEPDKTSSSKAAAVDQEIEAREDVHRLCHLLAESILSNDSKAKVVPDSKRWRDAARLLIDIDGHSQQEIEANIRWCQADDFWRANILSMSKLREQFTQLTLKRKASGGADRAQTDDAERQRRFDERAGTFIPLGDAA